MLVKFFATYREVTECKSVDIPPQPQVRALLLHVCQRWPGLRESLLSPDGQGIGAEAIVMVSGRHVAHLQGPDTPLAPTDVVALFPVVAGG